MNPLKSAAQPSIRRSAIHEHQWKVFLVSELVSEAVERNHNHEFRLVYVIQELDVQICVSVLDRNIKLLVPVERLMVVCSDISLEPLVLTAELHDRVERSGILIEEELALSDRYNQLGALHDTVRVHFFVTLCL